MLHRSEAAIDISGSEIVMTRVFNAPRKLVFECWTRPELFKRWMLGPPGTVFEVCVIELRVGGGYRFVWCNPDGSPLGMRGVYREIAPPESLADTQLFDEDWTGGETDGQVIFQKGFPMTKITPFLWFDGKAEEAMNFYCTIFKHSEILSVSRMGEGGPVMSATFRLNGQDFMALNGGPIFKFTEAISFFVNCETQAEVDELWDKLSTDGEPQQCGWLKDKIGLSWQIIPSALGRLMSDPDPVKSQRVMQAMLQMKKIDIAGLQRAHDHA